MEPDKAKARKTHRDEYDVGTKELGRKLQRRMPQQPMESSGSASRSAHGEDNSFDNPSNPPQHDRAG